MERLRQKDLLALLEFLRGIYAVHEPDGFVTQVITGLPKVVPSELRAYNEINPRRHRIQWVEHPRINFPGGQEIFGQHLFQHPILRHHLRTGDGRAVKISDFLSQRQFHRLGLYNEFYRKLDIEDQYVITLPSPPPLHIPISINRERRNFSERDRLLLNLLRPHLIQAYWNAEAATQMQQELGLAKKALEELDQGVIVLGRDRRIRSLSKHASRCLAEYFGRPPRSDLLPKELDSWVKHEIRLLSNIDQVPTPRKPLVLERDEKYLTVRMISDSDRNLLILEERSPSLQAASLEPLGLTRREAEVLAWVTKGKTSTEIAMILGTSPRTIEKHLERVYQKLGVENRNAATMRAMTFISKQGR